MTRIKLTFWFSYLKISYTLWRQLFKMLDLEFYTLELTQPLHEKFKMSVQKKRMKCWKDKLKNDFKINSKIL